MNLLGRNYDTENEAAVDLFKNGIMADGVDSNGKLLFKNTIPKTSSYVGTCEQIATEKFSLSGIKSIEMLKSVCKDRNIDVEFKDVEIYQKLTGLGTENFNYWTNYYLNKYNVDFEIKEEAIIVKDFKDNYEMFMGYIENLKLEGCSISVASTPNSIAYMHTNKSMSWSKISSKETGHVMLFKYFDSNGDIVVSSYGEDYIIPKEYFNLLEYNKIEKKQKQEELESKKRV